MSGFYAYSREAVRVKVKKCEGNQPPESRKFSVDPQITSFEVLQSILTKAFDIKGEFTICYMVHDAAGCEVYLPLLSDWELEAAFLKAHNLSGTNKCEPCLCLRVEPKPFEVRSEICEIQSNTTFANHAKTNNVEAKPNQRLHGLINQVGKTLNMVQKAFNFGEESTVQQLPPRPPLSDSEFRNFLNSVGQIVRARELRSAIYLGGIEPSLRKVVWKHLLNVYPDGMTGRERMDYIKKKAAEYMSLKEVWKAAVAIGPVVGELAYTTGMVKKDVLRTDRHHPFYAGSDDNQNIASLFNILTTYALNHPKVSYCQGMSDLASPLLVTMGDEAHAYICFCALMSRLNTNFMLDGIAMTQKFTHLAEALQYYDPEFYNYLKLHQADDLLFCYRWLLLEMKREFAFDDSLHMLEVLWSSLPADPPEKELKLLDVQFQPPTAAVTPPISPLVKTPRESAYTKVCALRRQSSSVSLASYMCDSKKTNAVKRQNHSLDETIGRCSIATVDVKHKHQSLDDAALTMRHHPKSKDNGDATKLSETSTRRTELLRPRSVSPLEQKSDSVILNNRINQQRNAMKVRSSSLSSSMTSLIKTTATKKSGHFKDLKEKIGLFSSSLDTLDGSNSIKEEPETKPRGKMVKNLNEFLNFASKSKLRLNSVGDATEGPRILLTKSSVDDSESTPRHCSSTSTNSCDDIFDEYSPDDSQEYFPMTTSVTREFKIELENLDRQVFGDGYRVKLLDDDVDSSQTMDDDEEEEEIVDAAPSKRTVDDQRHRQAVIGARADEVFVWENPLHKSSPNVACKTLVNANTPDEQAEIEYETTELGQLVDESSKRITPIKILKDEGRRRKSSEDEDVVTKTMPTHEILQTSAIGIVEKAYEEMAEAAKPSSTVGALPQPSEFGGGNPFLMFLCVTVLLQHRDQIMSAAMDYNEMAMHFDKMVRKHNVTKVLNQARQMYKDYVRQHAAAAQLKTFNKYDDRC